MKKRQKHGHTGNRIYNIYRGMRTRCYNKKDYHYNWYGARGIKICEDWDNDFLSFYEWSINNGYQDNLTIDRIDNNKDYSPDNCRWITTQKQCNNRRNNHLVTINGETHTIMEWSRISGLDRKVIERRLKKNISGENLLLPIKKRAIKK